MKLFPNLIRHHLITHTKNRLQAPTLARKLDILRFVLPVVRTDGWMGVRSVGHVINKISRIDKLPNFGART